MNWRSLLFVPADNEARCAKAGGTGADAVILDLEDGVALANKPSARARVASLARSVAAEGCEVVVRINADWRSAFADIDAAITRGVRAIMVPKVENSRRLAVLADIIAELEAERGLPLGHIGLVALIESPSALPHLPDIASAPRISALALGTEDFCLALDVAPTPEALDLPSRLIALAATGHGCASYAVPISIAAFKDTDAYAAAAARARAYGVTGALCIHPNQVAVAAACFAPTPAALSEAEQVMALWAQAQANGRSVIAHEGRMIDLPVVERARRLLAKARR